MSIDPGIFELKTPRDLLAKLERDYEKLRAAPACSDACFNFFVTAEHLPDWELPGDANDRQRKDLKKSNTLLSACSHIANGGKHFVVRSCHTAVTGTTKATWIEYGADGFVRASKTKRVISEALFVQIDGQGSPVSVVDLAKQLLDFWTARIAR